MIPQPRRRQVLLSNPGPQTPKFFRRCLRRAGFFPRCRAAGRLAPVFGGCRRSPSFLSWLPPRFAGACCRLCCRSLASSKQKSSLPFRLELPPPPAPCVSREKIENGVEEEKGGRGLVKTWEKGGWGLRINSGGGGVEAKKFGRRRSVAQHTKRGWNFVGFGGGGRYRCKQRRAPTNLGWRLVTWGQHSRAPLRLGAPPKCCESPAPACVP